MLNLFASQDQNIKNDVLSGITVALALVPEAVAFAFVAGVSPVIGLYSAFFLGFVTAIFGGRPGMISGATGAMAVVVVTLVAQHGIEYLFPAVILAGVVQIIVGLYRLGMLIRMVPHSVMLGFVNGLAIVIFTAQFGSFKSINGFGQLAFISGPALWIMLTLIGLTMSIIWLLPKFTRALSASLIAILFVTALSVVLNSSLDSRYAAENQSRVVLTVRDMLVSNATAAATADRAIEAALPLGDASNLAAVGLIESLMTMTLVDEITETRGSGNRECIGQGLANVLCGMFGGMGGCAMIGQSLINVNSGGRGRR
ncbi:MAG TPA: SulP family inorganic anion transporter [Planctomycetaceae bacterium]|nr:SulP family inorganic anion transporter [Planctomycetaceae bacterium]